MFPTFMRSFPWLPSLALALAALLAAASCGPERYRRPAASAGAGGGLDGAGGGLSGAGGDDGDSDGAAGDDGGSGRDADDASAQDGESGETGAVGCAGGAAQFDGLDDVLSVARQVQDDFTIEGWIKTSVPSLTGTRFFHGSGLFYADVMGMANDFAVAVLNNRIIFGVGDTTVVQSVSSVNTGQWVHVAVFRVRNTGQVGVLINGTVEATVGSAMTASLTAPVAVTFGGNTVDHRYFNGAIDELRIWNVPRTASDIRATMNRTLTGTEPGLVGYWRFDEPTGTDFSDRSPSHNTALSISAVTAPLHVNSDAPITECP